MARFCRQHIKLRTIEEIKTYYEKRSKVFQGLGPRATDGKNALAAMQQCNEELLRRGLNPKEILDA